MLSIIPIKSTPNYKFSTKIPIGGQSLILQFDIQYNELADYWILDVGDNNGRALLSCLPIVPTQNILEQYTYLQIGSAYIVPAQTIREQWPTRHTLGVDWYLLWDDTVGGLYG